MIANTEVGTMTDNKINDNTSGSLSNDMRSNEEYLPLDQQIRIGRQMDEIAKREPLSKTILFRYSTHICGMSSVVVFFLSWRAGFRGYGLYKFGKGRLLTIVSGLIFPANSFLAHESVRNKLVEPYRVENALHYGIKHALYHQVGNFCTIAGGISLTFLIANKVGILPIPPGMHKPGVREIAINIFFDRIKRYNRPIATAAIASTILAFCTGYGSYLQSCYILAKMGRKTLALKETSPMM